MSTLIIGDLLQKLTDAFTLHSFSLPRREAELLLSDLLGCSPGELYFLAGKTVSSEQQAQALSWLERRLQGEPLAYIHGQVEFYGCQLEVSPAVLIPRPETEILVDRISQELQKNDLNGKILWDLCCGSGCIGIALKKRHPDLSVVMSDISPAALAMAKRNAARNQVTLEIFEGDLLEPFHGLKADYFVCNPPYLTEAEYAIAEPSVKNFEPRYALVGGEQGSEFYRRLARQLPDYLNSGAKVWMEIGYQQGDELLGLFQGRPWINQKVKNDWAGHQRFFFLEIE